MDSITENRVEMTDVSANRRAAQMPPMAVLRARLLATTPPTFQAFGPEVGLYGVTGHLSDWQNANANHGKRCSVDATAIKFSTRLGPLTCSPPV